MSWAPVPPPSAAADVGAGRGTIPLDRALGSLARKVTASRVTLFERTAGEGRPGFRPRAVWPDGGEGAAAVGDMGLSLTALAPHLADLSRGEAVAMPVPAGEDAPRGRAGVTPRLQLFLPLLTGGALRGLLRVEHARPGYLWAAAEVALLRGAAEVLALALDAPPPAPAAAGGLPLTGPRRPGPFLPGASDAEIPPERPDECDLLRPVLAALAEGIAVVGADGACLLGNPAARRILRLPADEVLPGPGSRAWAAVREDGAEIAAADWPVARALRAGHDVGPEVVGIRWTVPAGETTWLRLTARPLTRPGEAAPYAAAVAFLDVTDAARTERALRTAEARARQQDALLDQASDAIVVRDLAGRVLFWNKGAEHLFGWPAAEAVGRDVRDLMYRGDDAPRQAAQGELFAKGEWRGEEVWLATRGGGRVAVESRKTLLRDAQGSPRAVLAVSRDLTERKQLEARLLLAQRLEVLGKLAGGIAHDLNNMLTPIRLGLDLLALGPPAEERAGLLATVRGAADQGAALLQQLLTFTRGSGRGPHEPVRLEAVLAKVRQMLRHTFPKSVAVESAPAPHLWTVHGDATQLVQLLVNLCVNARDAMPQGGTLRLEAANVMLRHEGGPLLPLPAGRGRQVGEARPGPYVAVRVRDGGAGMAPEVLNRIFDIGFTTKDAGKGTGLGLPTVLAIARDHGGFLTVVSEPGGGCEFAVYLPVTDAGPAHPGADEDSPLLPGRGECVLLVDDEDSIRDVVRATLEAFGYEVLCAAGGREALGLYVQQRRRAAAVLVDLLMPVMDGLATVRALKAIDPGVRIILASGALPPGAADAPDLRDVTFLPKPYGARRLLEVLRLVLGD